MGQSGDERFTSWSVAGVCVATLMYSVGCGFSGDVSVGGNRVGALKGAAGDVGIGVRAADTADSFVDHLGINTHFGYTESSYATQREQAVLPALDDLGVRHVREKAPLPDQAVLDLISAGRGVLLVYQGYPIAQAVALAKQLGPLVVEGVEGPSDTDYGPANYSYDGKTFPEGTRSYQQQLFDAFGSDPDLSSLPMLLPTVYETKNATLLGPLDSGTHCNVHARKPLAGTPSDDIDLLIASARVICGPSRPVMATSVGYSNPGSQDGSVSEIIAAKYLMRAALESFMRGVRRFYVYELIDEKPDPGGETADLHRGLLRSDGTKKKAFAALANLIAVLADPGADFEPTTLAYALHGHTELIHQALLEKRDGSFDLVLWQDVQSWDTVSRQALQIEPLEIEIQLASVAQSVVVFEPLNSSEPVLRRTSTERISLAVEDHPLVVSITP